MTFTSLAPAIAPVSHCRRLRQPISEQQGTSPVPEPDHTIDPSTSSQSSQKGTFR